MRQRVEDSSGECQQRISLWIFASSVVQNTAPSRTRFPSNSPATLEQRRGPFLKKSAAKPRSSGALHSVARNLRYARIFEIFVVFVVHTVGGLTCGELNAAIGSILEPLKGSRSSTRGASSPASPPPRIESTACGDHGSLLPSSSPSVGILPVRSTCFHDDWSPYCDGKSWLWAGSAGAAKLSHQQI